MVISNSKYNADKAAKSVKNRGFLQDLDLGEDTPEIPRYEELRFLRLTDHEE